MQPETTTKISTLIINCPPRNWQPSTGLCYFQAKTVGLQRYSYTCLQRISANKLFYYYWKVWDPFGRNLSNKLQRLQNRAARIIINYPNEHGRSEVALTELGWETPKERRLEIKTRLMYKIIHGFGQQCWQNNFPVLQLSDLMTTI